MRYTQRKGIRREDYDDRFRAQGENHRYHPKQRDAGAGQQQLASVCGVSRQVIVQDMALIRTSGTRILSTSRGYVMNEPAAVFRVFKVHHTDEQTEDELCCIVDLGGKILNVVVNHRVYGRMEAPLKISSRRKVKEFLDDIAAGKSSPLKNITSNYHYHTVEADSEEVLDLIEEQLRTRGYLVE